MKFRLKIMLCMIWLLSLAFGIGGSVMIWGSFSSALAQEKQTAEDSYRFLVRTIEMVNSINTLPNTSDIAGVLKQMDSMGITNFSAIRLLSGGVTEYTSGNTELSSDYTESGIVIETAPDGARYYKLSGTVGTEADTLAFIAFYDISSVFAMRDGQFKTYAAVFAGTIAVCAVLVPRFGVMGAAVGLVAANATMFLYRTVTGQYYYRTIPSFSRTICGFLLAVGVAVIGVVFAHNFIIKFVLTAAILFIYCNIYRAQLYKLWQISMGFVRRYLPKI